MPHPFSLNSDVRAELVQNLAAHVETAYVFPDLATSIARSLKADLDADRFATCSTAEQLSNELTKRLHELSSDQHFKVRYHQYPQPTLADDEDEAWIEAYWSAARLQNYGVQRVERLPGNIGYIDLHSIDDAEQTAETINAALTLIAHTYALILDLRRNNGGAPAGVAFLCSYFLGDDREAVQIDTIYQRVGDRKIEHWTRIALPGPRYTQPIFVLTSAKTFSGAEQLAYTLQSYQRATIVGETTAGAAHPIEVFQLNPQLELYVPSARPINPITKTNWEGTGVIPEISTSAAESYNLAYQKALEHAKNTLSEPHNPIDQGMYDEIETILQALVS